MATGITTAMDEIRIVPTTEAHVEGFHRCVDAVARERRYLGFITGPPLEQSRGFVRMLLDGGGVQVLAVHGVDEVVGWCDLLRDARDGFGHGWRLGMGLLPAARGRGVGRRLAQAGIAAAMARGAERIELEVFASNSRAVALYERLGFVREGVKRRARKLDGQYEDNVLMALLVDPPASGGPASAESSPAI
jgi:ribosomal protein S18 acetylase RimI-like enzyme